VLTERGAGFDIKLTKANVEYTVSAINNRDSRMISKKISLRSSFPFIRGYAASVRVALCYDFIRKLS
jgi:hypothetical protein